MTIKSKYENKGLEIGLLNAEGNFIIAVSCESIQEAFAVLCCRCNGEIGDNSASIRYNGRILNNGISNVLKVIDTIEAELSK